MLKEEQLFGTVDKVQIAIERLKEFERAAIEMNPSGYYVAFSGGKDSIVILDLVRRAGVKHTAHFNITTVDPPELLAYIRKYYPEVERHKPELSMFKLIRKKMMPPTRIVRYCCEHLKEGGGKDSFVVTGVRWAESVKRSKRRLVETCMRDSRKRYIHPIIDWSDADVWEYIRSNNMPYCCLYDEGFKRIGCVGCPMAGSEGRRKEFARWPKFEKAYREAFARAAADREERIQSGDIKLSSTASIVWKDGPTMFDWWMTDKREKEDENQMQMFE